MRSLPWSVRSYPPNVARTAEQANECARHDCRSSARLLAMVHTHVQAVRPSRGSRKGEETWQPGRPDQQPQHACGRSSGPGDAHAAAMPMLGYAQQLQGAGINYTAARPGRLILDLAIRSNETKREESGRRGGGARLWG